MTSTQVLLSKIAALRQRLADSEGSATPAAPAPTPLHALERKVALGAWHNSLIDSSAREMVGGPARAPEPMPAPVRLSARSTRLLQRARDLLNELRRLGTDPILDQSTALGLLYHETAAMLDSLLRAFQAFPQTPSAQVRLCDGLEVILKEVASRVATLKAGLDHRRLENGKVETLAALLSSLAQGQSAALNEFGSLADTLVEEARNGLPLHFFEPDFETPARFVASHSLVVAQIIARLTATDSEWQGRLQEPALAALVYDVGMLEVPVEILAQPEPLSDAQRRLVEKHPVAGAEIIGQLAPSKGWLAEAAACHHERIDGTGYPSGVRTLPPLVRLVTVCDIYAALCSPRPYRAALETRTALTDTLLLAEQGGLDQFQAERLLDLSFYPVGSVVELTDGAIGVVVATHSAKKDLQAPARPIIALLVDSQGQPLPYPHHLDLSRGQRSILRNLPADERQELLGNRYPELV